MNELIYTICESYTGSTHIRVSANSVFSHQTMHLICLCDLAHCAILGYSIHKYLVVTLCAGTHSQIRCIVR